MSSSFIAESLAASSMTSSRNTSFNLSYNESSSRSSKIPVMAMTERVNPSMLTNPLTLQATTLRNAEYYEQTMLPSLVEEGDILFPVLCDPLSYGDLFCLTLSPNNVLSSKIDRLFNTEHHINSDNFKESQLCCNYYARFGIQPVLTFPSKVGVYMTNEVFRAFLCFYNTAPYSLHDIHILVEYGAAQASSRVLLLQTTIATLEAKRRWSFVAEMPLLQSGICNLHVKVNYSDPTNEVRQLIWASSIPVEEGIRKVNQTLRRIHMPYHALEQMTSLESIHNAGNTEPNRTNKSEESLSVAAAETESISWRNSSAEVFSVERTLHLPWTVYMLSVSLSNASSVPLVLAEVSLISSPRVSPLSESSSNKPERSFQHPLFTLIHDKAAWTSPSSQLLAVTREEQQEMRNKKEKCEEKLNLSSQGILYRNNNKWECTSNEVASFMQPNETRTITFLLVLNVHALRNQVKRGVVRSSKQDISNTAILPSAMAELGHIYWRWNREDGESGSYTSPMLRLGRLRVPAELQLVIASISQDGKPYTPHCHSNSIEACSNGQDTANLTCNNISFSGMSCPPNTSSLYCSNVVSNCDNSNELYCSLSVGTPVTFECVLLNYSETKQIDVALKVRCEKLVPYWIYAGAAVKPLGILEPLSSLRFTVELIPWQVGWLPVDGEGLTIVNARMLDLVLLPLSLSSGNALSSPLSSPVGMSHRVLSGTTSTTSNNNSNNGNSNNSTNINTIKSAQSFVEAPKWLEPLSSTITGGLPSASGITHKGKVESGIVNTSYNATSVEQIQASGEDEEDENAIPLCTVLVM